MKTLHVVLLTACAAVLAAAGPVLSQRTPAAGSASVPLPPSGMLRTMPVGQYQCALAGDAGGQAYQVVEEEGFRISTQSRYTNADGAGTYILRGNALTFTRGPKNGERFERVGENQLRKLSENGNRSGLLCTRLSDNRR